METIAGVDEVGRGPLAGPVVAAAVILKGQSSSFSALKDSKRLTAKQRELWYTQLIATSIWAIGRASVAEIDQLNILQASLLAMQRAIQGLSEVPDHVLVDGNHLPQLTMPAQAIIGGDAKILCIAAASIVAKVTRDREMVALDKHYPGYGLAQHKGYPTAQHLAAIKHLGVQKIHRQSFAPVKKILNQALTLT
jgi:ribonuclease HII